MSSEIIVVTSTTSCHEQNLSGYLLAQSGWEHLCLPAEYEGSKRAVWLGFVDLRENQGELLWPDRFGVSEIDSLKRSLGLCRRRAVPAASGSHRTHDHQVDASTQAKRALPQAKTRFASLAYSTKCCQREAALLLVCG